MHRISFSFNVVKLGYTETMSHLFITHKLIVLYVLILQLIYTYAYDAGGFVQGCAEDELLFGCKFPGTQVVIKYAWLHNKFFKIPKESCHIPEFNRQFKMGSVLQHINKQCVAKNICRFKLFEDVRGAADERQWKDSVITLDYECVPSEPMRRTCGKVIQEQNGWIHNVGYPKYYLGPGACTYTIQADTGQSIDLTIHDLSLKEIVRPIETECTDKLEVTEKQKVLLTQCGTSNKPLKVSSEKNILNITLHSFSEVETKRGFVAHFQARGCPTPPIPKNGELVYRNHENLIFKCDDKHVFRDSLRDSIKLTCRRNETWDLPVADCVDIEVLYLDGNITQEQYLVFNGSSILGASLQALNFLSDVTIPCIVMVVMFVCNILVLIAIRNRRKQNKEIEDSSDEQKDNIELKQKLLSEESAKV